MKNICDDIADMVPEPQRVEVRDRVAQLEQVVMLLASERSIEALIARLVLERDQAKNAQQNALARGNECLEEARQARALLAKLLPYAATGLSWSTRTQEEDDAAQRALDQARALVPWCDR